MITRRLLFAGAAASVIASPSIVRAASLMPVRALAFDPLADLFAEMNRFMRHRNVLLRMESLYGNPYEMPVLFTGIPNAVWRKFNQGVEIE